tara:strand:+ start:230 stop:682 length:453 start_codon:yes stop_codon:yes gene_type:complete
MRIIYILLFLFTLNCSVNKVSNVHGYRFLEDRYNKIILNSTNKNDLRKLIGPPSTKSDFDDSWLYFERKKTNQSLIKLGKKSISKNNVIKVDFNEFGLVSNKEFLNLDDMNEIKISKLKTYKKFSVNNFTYNILSTVREKINAPTRKKRN